MRTKEFCHKVCVDPKSQYLPPPVNNSSGMGKRRAICGNAVGTSFEARRWLSLDPCGCGGVLCSWGVHLFALSTAWCKLLESNRANTIIYFSFYVPASALALLSLWKAWTTDPGSVPLGAHPLVTVRRASSNETSPAVCSTVEDNTGGTVRRRGLRRCHKCNDNYKPPRAHHDSVTGRCAVKFDHFCPWVGNAVGALNHKFFCLFLLYTAVSCLLVMLMLSLRFIQCPYIGDEVSTLVTGSLSLMKTERNIDGENNSRRALHRFLLSADSAGYVHEGCASFHSGTGLLLALSIVSLVFLIFTCAMGCEQMEAIKTGKGKIARMKQRVGQAGTEFRRVTEEFNEMFGGNSVTPVWHWFLPIAVTFPRGMKKVVLGFDYDESFSSSPYQEEEHEEFSTNTNCHATEMQDLEVGRGEEDDDTGIITPTSSLLAADVNNNNNNASSSALERTDSERSLGNSASGVRQRNGSAAAPLRPLD